MIFDIGMCRARRLGIGNRVGSDSRQEEDSDRLSIFPERPNCKEEEKRETE
jgi:hypothetical protein